MIESVDSLKLAAEIDRQAKKHGISMDILCEINIGKEENKSGIEHNKIAPADIIVMTSKEENPFNAAGIMLIKNANSP
jgi:uncharacterized pyridoxal phosphate-containing UPF0001 family protein